MKKKNKLLLSIALLVIFSSNLLAKDYDIKSFGAKNNGTYLNTAIIQGAIDYIHENGGGRLVFDSGQYLTGTIYLKSNVTLHIKEGAVLLGSTNPFDYTKDKEIGWMALIFSIRQKNIGITGKGTINGQGFKTGNNAVANVHKAIVQGPLNYDRIEVNNRPVNIYFMGCNNVKIHNIILKNPASWNQIYRKCKDVAIKGITVDSKSYWNNDGIDILNCDGVVIKNSYIDAADDCLCFKSFDPHSICQNVVIDSCVVRSSANGLKFGSTNKGGFKNFKITNLKFFDTYRSAIALEDVDGGIIENILIDGVKAYNTGNIIYLRMGDRRSKGRVPTYKNIVIKNVYGEVPVSKPDSGYNYEGPIEDLPRNISPASITGLPQYRIQDITLKNIEIVYPGGGNPNYAKAGTSQQELESIPEMPAAYPDFSQFKELPAWGFYIRHVDNITLDNIVLKAREKDYRPAIVFDDVTDISLKKMDISEPKSKDKKQIIFNHSTKRHP